MARKVYPSDISRAQFEAIRSMLESARHKTSPREVDLYDVFCAILYLLKNGCAWRAIPGDFPGWNTVRYYFDRGRRASGAGSARKTAPACWSRP
jgi:transposase